MSVNADTPIKRKDSDGTLRQLTNAEENYLAYQAGLRLSVAPESDVGSLTTSSSSASTVGTYTDTKFNQAVGTHGTTLTTQTTNTVLYQKEGDAPEDGASGRRRPIHYDISGSQTQLQEMTSSEMDTLVDRLVSTIFTNDYAGTYKLATSAPTGYSTALSNVFTDTRTDGSSINYSIYRRTSQTAPIEKQPVLFIKRSGGHTGTFQGLQSMTAAQMQYSFGQRAKNRIMSGNNGVGTYLLLSSTQGNPTTNGYAGTWVSKGSATDTKNTTAVQDYTRTSTRNFEGNYTRLRPSTYTRTRTSNYVRTFEGNFSRSFTGNFVGNYTRVRTENYSRAFAGNYVGGVVRSSNYTGNYTRNFEGTRVSNYVGNYSRGFTRNYSRNITDSYTGNYTRNYNAPYSRTFVGNFTGNYTGTSTYTRNYTGNYIGGAQYVDGNAPGIFSEPAGPGRYYWQISPEPVSNTELDWTTIVWYAGAVVYSTTDDDISTAIARTSVTTGGKTYNRGPLQSQQYSVYKYSVWRQSGTTNTDFTRTVSGFTGNFTGNFTGGAGPYGTSQAALPGYNPTPYYYWLESSDPVTDISYSSAVWNGTSVGGPTVLSYTASGQANPPAVPDYESSGYGYNRGSFIISSTQYKFSPVMYYYSIKRRILNVQYTRTSTRTSIATFSREVAYTRTSTRNRSSSYSRSFARAFTRISTRLRASNYSRAFTRNYTRTSTRNVAENYARAYTRTSTRNFDGTVAYVGNYSRNYSRTFTGNYTRTSVHTNTLNYSRNSNVTYSRNFTGNYSRNITDSFTRTSARNYLGNYGSDTIQSGNETIETYTLYVRTA